VFEVAADGVERGLDIFKHLHRLGAKTLRRLAARIDAGLAGDENDPVRSVDLDHLAVVPSSEGPSNASHRSLAPAGPNASTCTPHPTHDNVAVVMVEWY
jgi:hypothetical protein